MSLDFSTIEVGRSLQDIEHNFKQQTNSLLDLLRVKYAGLLDAMPQIDLREPVSNNLKRLC